MNDEHDQYREWAAAYILGALEPAERADYQRHLATCERCQADVNEFSALPGLLAQLEPEADAEIAASTDRVTELAIARANDDYERLQTSSRRWRATALGAVAAAAILLAVGAVATLGGSRTGGTELAFTDSVTTGSFVVEDKPWGTQIEIELEGLGERDWYQLWAISDDGSREAVATWTSTPGGLASLTSSTAIGTADLDRLVITSDDPDDVVLQTD